MDPTQILRQLGALNDARVKNHAAAREQMLVVAQALVASLQTPSELICSVGMAEPAKAVCIRMAIDLKIFETLDVAGRKGASAVELAEPTGADTTFVSRTMKHLAATNTVQELSEDRYAHTVLSSQLSQPRYRGGIIYCHDLGGPSFQEMPSYFARTNYQDSHHSNHGPFQSAHKTEANLYSWFDSNPYHDKAFNSYMSGYRDGRRPWFKSDFYPVQEQLVDGFEETKGLLLIDVGGGKGHDLLALRSEYPKLPGRLVLQDKPEVLLSIDPPLPSGIEGVPHDFFQPQPKSYHGARAYFMHSVLHNWDDESCVKILTALKPGLIPGYSRVLIHDLIVPDTKASWSVTGLDWFMVAVCGVRERTESEFRKLFDAAGLMIEKIWVYGQGTEAVIEAILPAQSNYLRVSSAKGRGLLNVHGNRS